MTATFLHDDKKIPPDEIVDTDAPLCECGQRMWLTRIETKTSDLGRDTEKQYECKVCGVARTVFLKR